MAAPAKFQEIAAPADDEVETWENLTNGRIDIIRRGEYGSVRHELVKAHRKFTITPSERRMNQVSVATDKQDPFTNGDLRPVKLLPGEADTAQLLENPNFITDDDLDKIFKSKGEAFAERVASITNTSVLEELISKAKDPANKVLVSQYETLRQRLAALKQAKKSYDESAVDARATGPSGERQPKAVTPR